jgi:uncharacterized protein (DUF1697 family)
VTRHIALLRGINIASNRRVSMPELRDLLAEHGYEGVATYVQSGNVVLTAEGRPETVARDLEKAMADAFGQEIEVVARTREELADAIERNPFSHAVKQPRYFQVTFLSGQPDADAVAKLTAEDWGDDELAFDGREAYAYYADGMQKSKLARRLTAAKLGATATARNWNTVTKMLELADAE